MTVSQLREIPDKLTEYVSEIQDLREVIAELKSELILVLKSLNKE